MSAVSDSNLSGAAAAVSGRPPLAVPRRILRMRSDIALAERFVAGDEAAFDVIYERHRPAVLAVCMGILGAAHDAEDATQETFSALALALRSHPPNELRPWLTRVARNASIDTTRRRRHRLLTIDGEIPEVPARQSNAAGELNSVLDGIRELPEGQRTALLMRELGGHSYGEIANFLEIDEDAVRGLIARARVGLRSYREATEMPCTSARAAIEAEPDGRRHDKTVRRHLRSCTSCRSYRSALRGDAKALRAVFPWQAGGLAGTGLAAGGAVTAAKSAMVGVSLTQLAATCAASVCAVGAVGGVVLFDPTHRLLNSAPVTAPVKHHRHHPKAVHHAASPAATTHVAVEIPATTPAAPVFHPAKHVTPVDSWHRRIPHSHAAPPPTHPAAPQHQWGWQSSDGTSGFSSGQSAGGDHQPTNGSGSANHGGTSNSGGSWSSGGSWNGSGSWNGDHGGSSAGNSNGGQSYGGATGYQGSSNSGYGASGGSWQRSSYSRGDQGSTGGSSYAYSARDGSQHSWSSGSQHSWSSGSQQTWSSARTAFRSGSSGGQDHQSNTGQSWQHTDPSRGFGHAGRNLRHW